MADFEKGDRIYLESAVFRRERKRKRIQLDRKIVQEKKFNLESSEKSKLVCSMIY